MEGVDVGVSERPTVDDLLGTRGALLGVKHLRQLGLDDRAIARVLKGLPEIVFDGVECVYYAAEDVVERLRMEGRRR